MSMSEILELTSELIRRRSVTPDDAGCQALIGRRLQRAGFAVESMRFGEVDNLWATHGSGDPVLVFLGHSDVVPSGPESAWTSPPFEPTIRDGIYSGDRPDRGDQKAANRDRTPHLFGRGAADMKSGLAAMTLALEALVAAAPDHAGTLALLVTSDEEGPTNENGVRRVAEEFRRRGQRIDWCVVGEPSSAQRLGDVIRVGRRGSLSATLTVRGVQGHVAYPEKVRNPIHLAAPALAELAATKWDGGNDEFPPTSLQISNVHAGTGAGNVVPGTLVAMFNFRFCTESSAEVLRERSEAILRRHGLDYSVDWNQSGDPFVTKPGPLRRAASEAIRQVCGVDAQPSTAGGTSDGRFIAPLGAEVVEVGPVNASIHKIDENIALVDLERLPRLYRRIVETLLSAG